MNVVPVTIIALGSALFFAAAATFASGEEAAGSATPAKPVSVHVVVQEFYEYRSTSKAEKPDPENFFLPSGLSLSLSIFTEGVRANTVLRRVVVTRAIDNLDREIALSATAIGPLAALQNQRVRSANPLLQWTLNLQSTVRSAETIKLIEGNVELISASESNGSLIRIPNVTGRPGVVENTALARSNIEFRYLDKAGWEEVKGKFTQVIQGQNDPDFTRNAFIFYRDPSNLVAGCEFQDSEGGPIPTRGIYSGAGPAGNLFQITLASPLPADAQLVVFLAVPEALKAVPFKIENLALP